MNKQFLIALALHQMNKKDASRAAATFHFFFAFVPLHLHIVHHKELQVQKKEVKRCLCFA